jgi:hypothetical protein
MSGAPPRRRRGSATAFAGSHPAGSGLLALALLLGLSCHGSAQTAAAPAGEARPDAAALVDHAHVYLISPHDAGRAGRKVACDDSAVAVEATLPEASPALPGAMRALLAMRERYDRGSGLLNQLYASRLDLAGIDRQGPRLVVRLSGYVERGDACDNARMLAELTATALQFDGISEVRFELDGQPLTSLLAGGGPPPAAEAPATATVPPLPATGVAPPPPSDALPPRPPDVATPAEPPG